MGLTKVSLRGILFVLEGFAEDTKRGSFFLRIEVGLENALPVARLVQKNLLQRVLVNYGGKMLKRRVLTPERLCAGAGSLPGTGGTYVFF